MASSAGTSSTGHDVMISYQWDAQERMKVLKQKLNAAGISAWMDLEQMVGNMNDRMAEAVEGSKAILICFSQKYQDSANCKKEAEYAEKRKKKIIPLMYEKHDPSGWLGLLIGPIIYYDVSSDEALDKSFDAIVKAIKGKPASALPSNSATNSTQNGMQKLSQPDIRLIANRAELRKADLDNLFEELGISEADIDNGRRNADTNDFKLQSSTILRAWLKKKASAATRNVIIKALRDCNLNTAADFLEKEWGITAQ